MIFPQETDGSASAQPPEAAGGAPDSPRQVIRGESSQEPQSPGKVFGAFTDYLNVTFPLPSDWRNKAAAFFCRLADVVGPAFGRMESLGRGFHGYGESYAFERGHVRYAFGGQAGTGMFSIPGEGCALVPDWSELTRFLRDALHARITRWDGAVDDYNGVHSVDEAVQLYRAGAFNAGGRAPSCAVAGNWISEDQSGRTLYVGKRRNGKLLRVYEKGKQLGLGSSPWTRWEVELHNVDRVIPWEVIANPAPHIAGAYPALSWVSTLASRIPTLQRSDSISYNRLIFYAQVAYGQLIETMLSREAGDAEVLELLRRPGVPARLELTEALGIRNRAAGEAA
jgi:phage replication initiation protein